MTPEQAARLMGEIGALKAQCEELRVRKEMLEYHLGREKRKVRELESELQETRAVSRFIYGAPQPSLGWGKGKDE